VTSKTINPDFAAALAPSRSNGRASQCQIRPINVTDCATRLLSIAKGTALNQPSVKIMVVDDSKTIRRSATSLLEKEGYEVITAEDGFDALGKVVTHNPDLVFADVSMPRLDGYQTCALIKNNMEYRDIPVVMLSSKDSIFDKARGRIVGSEHYLTKPFTRRDLVRAVKRHVRDHDREDRVSSKKSAAAVAADLEFAE